MNPSSASPEQNVISDPFLRRKGELSGAVIAAERSADELWKMIDDCVDSIQTLHSISVVAGFDEPAKALGCMRSAIDSSQDFYETLRYNQAILGARMKHLLGSIDRLRSFVDRSAMNYGINRLPNEILLRIFLNATSGLRSTVALSHVCNRFRSIVIGSHDSWGKLRLSSEWSAEQNPAIASRSAPHPLRVALRCPRNATQALSESTTAILSLDSRIQELSLYNFDTHFHGTLLQWHLKHCHFPILKVISSSYSSRIISSSPHAGLEMPSLRVLDVDFLPNSWQAVALTGLFLDCETNLSLSELLVFPSSVNNLHDLGICAISIHGYDEAVNLPTVFTHNLVTFRFIPGRWVDPEMGIDVGVLLAQKIRIPSLHTLGVGIEGDLDSHSHADRDSISHFMAAYQSIKCLEIRGVHVVDLWHIPHNVEEFTVRWDYCPGMPSVCPSGALSSHRIRLVRFEFLNELSVNAVLSLRDLLVHNNITASFDFNYCSGFRSGIFDSADVPSAFIG